MAQYGDFGVLTCSSRTGTLCVLSRLQLFIKISQRRLAESQIMAAVERHNALLGVPHGSVKVLGFQRAVEPPNHGRRQWVSSFRFNGSPSFKASCRISAFFNWVWSCQRASTGVRLNLFRSSAVLLPIAFCDTLSLEY